MYIDFKCIIDCSMTIIKYYRRVVAKNKDNSNFQTDFIVKFVIMLLE